jgi:arylsulfatase
VDWPWKVDFRMGRPFSFTGKIDKRTITFERPQLTPADIQKLKEAEIAAADAK